MLAIRLSAVSAEVFMYNTVVKNFTPLIVIPAFGVHVDFSVAGVLL